MGKVHYLKTRRVVRRVNVTVELRVKVPEQWSEEKVERAMQTAIRAKQIDVLKMLLGELKRCYVDTSDTWTESEDV